MPDDRETFRRALTDVAREFVDDATISEAELVNRWFMVGVFSALGYGTHRDDFRVELRIPGAGRADVVLRAFGQRARAVIEFKRPRTPLDDHVRQVKDYADQLLPDVAILTNGRDLWLYSRVGPLPLDPLRAEPARYDLTTLTDPQARELFDRLRKAEVDITNLAAIEEALQELAGRPVRVEGPRSPGGFAFLDRLSLDVQNVFGRLVRSFFDALPILEDSSQFTAGAYAFWRRAYARELSSDEAPRTWLPLLEGRTSANDIRHFMFALESAYAVLARALLAKAMQDAGFPAVDVVEAFRHSAQIHHSQGRLAPADLLTVVQETFEYAGRQAFPTLFASDIFDWWQDADALPDPDPIAAALVETTLAVFGFDFSGMEGDVLGDLYQNYFDPETRLALGEFYTPPEVVEFILDSVGYEGDATDRTRLLDPACGSGTFLVAALRRYLRAHRDGDASGVLARLVGGLHIVGLDVNPFATLLSQVNYAAQLLPLYAEALQQGPLVVRNLPVFRTDSLRFERREAEDAEHVAVTQPTRGRRRRSAPLPGSIGFRLTYSGDMAQIRERLPVRRGAEEFVEVLVSVPRSDLARERRLVDNLEEYALALSALFDSVDEGEDQAGLAIRLHQHNLLRAQDLAEFMAPALSDIRATIERLRTEYEDGRFRKTLRDLAVAVVVKNELPYDFVVGNPPYVRVQRLPDELKAYWTGRYAWAQGNFDLYMPFIERAVTDWLRDGGRLGFICSDRFLLANYAEQLRTHLREEATPEIILDLRDTRVFRGPLNYPAIFVFRKAAGGGGDFLAGRAFADPEEGTAALLQDGATVLDTARTAGSYRQGQYVDAFPMPLEELTGPGWYLMPRAERRVFDSLRNAGTHPLEDLTATESGGFAGYQTSADDVMVLRLVEERGDRLLLRPKGGGGPAEIERAAVRPWLFGRDVERWYVDWDNWYVLFPYVKVNEEYKLAPSREHGERFPYADRVPFVEDTWRGFWEYVTRGWDSSNHRRVRSTLEAREDGKFNRNRPSGHLWYGASYPRSIDLYERPKLVLQVSSTAPDVAIDLEGRYVFAAGGTSGVYGVLLKTEYERYLALLGAILNSRPLDFFLKHVSTVYSGSAYSYGDQFLKLLPIRLPVTARERSVADRLESVARQLAERKSDLRMVERACAAFPAAQSEELPSGVDLYPLERLADGEPAASTLQRNQVTFDIQLDGRPALRAGHTTLVLPTVAHANVVRAWLEAQSRQLISTSDLINLRLPETEAGCRFLLDALHRQRDQVDALRRQIAESEQENDELVLRLYGLDRDRDARSVIDDFLARF